MGGGAFAVHPELKLVEERFLQAGGVSGFVGKAELTQAAGWTADSEAERLLIRGVATTEQSTADLADAGKLYVSFTLLRTASEEAVKTSHAVVQPGTPTAWPGTEELTLLLPPGSPRPPFLRVELWGEDAYGSQEPLADADIKLALGTAAREMSVRLMAEDGFVNLRFAYEVAADPSGQQVDWQLVWRALPQGWDTDGHLDYNELLQWLSNIAAALDETQLPLVAQSLAPLLAPAAYKRSDLLTSDTDSEPSSRSSSRASTRPPSKPGSRRSSAVTDAIVEVANATAKVLNISERRPSQERRPSLT